MFASALAPSLPTDPAVHGVSAVAHGTFPADTARPVTTVTASVYCAPGASSAAVATAAAVRS